MEADLIVIGAGFGGLGAALTAAEAGAKVLLLEALSYPGGCASTFSRGGYRFDAGATLVSGLGPGQLFDRWTTRHGLPITVRPLDPVVELRAPGLRLDLPPSRAGLIAALIAAGCDEAPLRRFFAVQARVADALWPVLDDPGRLPPFDLPGLIFTLKAAPRLLPALRWAGRPLGAVLRATGAEGQGPLRVLLDALCQITVQARAEDAEAPLALSAIDYLARGAAHLDGGVGTLAVALTEATRARGGQVALASRVRGLRWTTRGWEVEARDGAHRAPRVLANLLPQDLRALLGWTGSWPVLDRPAAAVAEGWGAVMLYRGLVDHPDLPEGARHVELVGDPAAPFVEGNHVFCSLSARDEAGRAPEGQRTLTVSTHIAAAALRGVPPAEQAARVQQVQDRMRALIAARAPELLAGGVAYDAPGSPRTFQRFTRRSGGLVGGVPRLAGWGHYRDLLPVEVGVGLWLVGDSVFPGQSALAAALGGARTARAALGRGWGRRLLRA